jgi:hypothetical protein
MPADDDKKWMAQSEMQIIKKLFVGNNADIFGAIPSDMIGKGGCYSSFLASGSQRHLGKMDE